MIGGRRNAALAVVLLLAVAPVAGCRHDDPGPSPCGWLAESPRSGAGRLAVLVDVSASTRSASGVGSVDYPPALREEIERAVTDQRTVALSAFGGPASDLSLTIRSTNWKEQARNAANQAGKREDARDCLTDDVRQVQQVQPTGGGTDVLRAVSQASAWLRMDSTAPSRHLVIATDGLVTHGCADLTRSRFRGQPEIDAIAGECLKGEIQPKELDGIAVTMIGVGHPAADQPIPGTAQAAWLRTLWARLCAEAGGTCAPDAGAVPRSTAAGPTAGTAAGAQDPPVSFGPDLTSFSVPGALFDTGRWTLRPEAARVLTRIAVQIRSKPYTKVVVEGYADPRAGGDVDNQTLSENRARAVAEALAADGVRSPQPRGMGPTTTCFDGTAVAPGDNSDAALQCLRRVDITAS